MKMSDIQKTLSITRQPVRNKKKWWSQDIWCWKKIHDVIQATTTHKKSGHGHKRRKKGRGFGMLAAGVAVLLITSVINKL